ncbi:pyridoxal-phosphate-dependent aminotransferase family protein [Streptomyces hygroscopicus]|uniref:pyridoxal-phosphate-dependent aminotransferase family protein n=1 Tax=Streptomyces hygroscopicus TaxID=1912 RepID=UPI001FCC8C1C|nr:aminotransferase class V-fold PLP-dependent enzyme [Streptomyces hygroscopicus]BDH09647.1 2-aminoethylphosphonate--pyruvate transaminase [Streptomyces hygroscopicus]
MTTDEQPQRLVLMNPGPVVTDDRVRAALSGPDMCHRERDFATLMTRVRSKVTRISGGGADHTAVVLTGSGTSAVEAAIVSAVPAHGGLLVLDNGHYGHRLHEIATPYGIRSRRLEFGWGTPLGLGAVERALRDDQRLTHVGVVHHETSTGMLNDVAAVAALAHRHGREVVVDAVSSVGCEPLSLERDGIDWLAGSANKCLEGAPGLSFVCARRDAFVALATWPRRTHYLDLHRHFTAQEKAGAPAFTPAVPAFHAFDIALDLALAEGVEGRRARYAALAGRLREGLTRLGLRLLLPDGQRAVGLTAVRLPDEVGFEALHSALRAEGFVIYAAQEQLAQGFFRLSTMGQLTGDDIERFLATLARLLPRLTAAPSAGTTGAVR